MSFSRRQFVLGAAGAAGLLVWSFANTAFIRRSALTVSLKKLAKDPWFRPFSESEPSGDDYLPRNDWAMLAPYDDHVLAIFYKRGYRRSLGIFDEIHFRSLEHARAGLRKNGFGRYWEHSTWKKLVKLPEGEFLDWDQWGGRPFSRDRFWIPVAAEAPGCYVAVDDEEDLISVAHVYETEEARIAAKAAKLPREKRVLIVRDLLEERERLNL